MLNPLKNVLTVEMVRSLIAKIKGALETKVSMDDVVSSWQSTPDDAHVPTEKLVKDTLDNLPPGTAVKGDAESEYRTGNVNLTPANIGAYSKTESDNLLNAKENAVNKKQSVDPTSTTDFLSAKAVADFVNSSVATNTATFLGNFRLADLGLTYPATEVQIAAALNSHTWPTDYPTNNDYVYVEIRNPQSTIDDKVQRYKYRDGLASWGYEYTLNNSSFTAEEKASIDSGITSQDVTNLRADHTTLGTHVADINNPHQVTATQVGAEPAFSVLPVNKGGTGKTSVTAGNYLVGNGTSALTEKTPKQVGNNVLPALNTGSDNVLDTDYIIASNHTLKATDTTAFVRRTADKLWNYIKDKISSVLGLSESNGVKTFTGNAATATSATTATNYASGGGIADALAGKSSTSHTHSVKINGTTKTIPATGGTAVDLGTYLTSHQDISGKLDKTGDASNTTSTFTKSSGDTSSMTSGTKLSAIFTAISGFFASFKALAFKDKVSDSDISGTISNSHIASASTWNGKQDSLPKSGTSYAIDISGYAARAGSAGTASHATTASNYASGGDIDTALQGKSSTSHTHSVKINGSTKTIAATGGTAVDLGTYLTSHQAVSDNNPTLAWGATSKVGTVGSTDLRVTMPSNPASGKLDTNGDGSNVTAAFTAANTRANISTGDKLSVIFGKIAKWFADLKSVAWSGSYNDLSEKPNIPAAANNGILTITQNGTSKGTFGANQSSNNTIALTDTTYESKSAASGGTDVSLCTTGEKYTWNGKQNTVGTDTDSSAFSDSTTIATGFGSNKIHLNVASRLWTYIQGKISSVIGLTAAKYNGAAATNRCERGTNDGSTDYDTEFAKNTAYVKEMPPLASHSPDAVWNHLYTSCGTDTGYAVQLAIGMMGNSMYIRHKDNGAWTAWLNLRHAGTWFDTGILPIERGGTGKNNLANVTVGMATNAQTAESVGKTIGSNSVAVSTNGIGLVNGVNAVTIENGRVNATVGFGGNLNGNADSSTRSARVIERYHSDDTTQDIMFSKSMFTPPGGSMPASGLVVWGIQNNYVEFSSMSSSSSNTYLHAILDSSYQKKSDILLSSSGAIQYSTRIGTTSGNQTLSGTGSSVSVTQNSKIMLDVTINNNGDTNAVLLMEVMAGSTSLSARIFFANVGQTVAIPFGMIYTDSSSATLTVRWSVQSGSFIGSFYTRWLVIK